MTVRSLLIAGLLLSSCGTTQSTTNHAPDRSMLGLDAQPLTDEWVNWTPTSARGMPDISNRASAVRRCWPADR